MEQQKEEKIINEFSQLKLVSSNNVATWISFVEPLNTTKMNPEDLPEIEVEMLTHSYRFSDIKFSLEKHLPRKEEICSKMLEDLRQKTQVRKSEKPVYVILDALKEKEIKFSGFKIEVINL